MSSPESDEISPPGGRRFRIVSNSRAWISGHIANIGKSFTEVAISALFTFAPFLVLSVPWTGLDGHFAINNFSNRFSDYWSSGQIVLPIFGVCGAITALIALNAGYFPWLANAVVISITSLLLIVGGAALSVSDRFNENLHPELVLSGFVIYLILIILWWYLVFKVRTTQPQIRRSYEQATEILNTVRQRRSDRGPQ